MQSDSISYNPTLFESDGGPYDSRKLQNGRPKQRSEKKGEGKKGGRMSKTHFGYLASPPPLFQLPIGSNKREDLEK